MKTQKLILDVTKLPLKLELFLKGVKKRYTIKLSKDKKGIYMN